MSNEMFNYTDLWVNYTINENKEKLKSILKEKGLIFFFKKDDDIFGGPEESRLMFANLKNPDENTPKGWETEISFLANNLSQFLKLGDHLPSKMFYNRDIKNIRIIPIEDIEKELFQ